MRWSERQTYFFVKQYMKYENLWNQNHDDHKKSSVRMNSYKELISQFRNVSGIELNIAELKLKIRSLRSTYQQEVLKVKRRSSPNNTYKPNLRWFAYWNKYVMKKEGSYCAFDKERNNMDNELWALEADNNSDSTPIHPFPEDDEYNNGEIILKIEPADSIESDEHLSKLKVRQKMTYVSPIVESCNKTPIDNIDSDESRKEDEFEIYARYIATQLRSMDLKKALRVQLKIQSLLSEARISDLVKKN